MATFPSVEWFKAARDLANNSESFKHFGTCDTEMGVKVDDRYFEIDFEAFEVADVKEIDEERAAQLDFTLVQSYDDWKSMLLNIKEHGRAEHEFTLNSLDLRSAQELAIGKDYVRRDAFYRFNQTIQDFFDLSAKIDTAYAK